MHCLLFVCIPKDVAESSREAREYFNGYLLENEFTAEGRFSLGIDWLVIGGRYSGKLTEAHMNQHKLKQFHEEFGKKYGWWYGGNGKGKIVTEEQRRRQALALWRRYFPEFQGEIPDWRNDYAELGYDDDAMIVDDVIFKRIVKGHVEETPTYEEGEVIFEDDPDDSTKTVGKCWIVVVDYHF